MRLKSQILPWFKYGKTPCAITKDSAFGQLFTPFVPFNFSRFCLRQYARHAPGYRFANDTPALVECVIRNS